MKVVILAGGKGTRLSEETQLRPKPMVEVGGMPLLWHIMKIYSQIEVDEFIICLGHKGEVIKRFFLDYHALRADLSIDLASGEVRSMGSRAEQWKVTLVETGTETMTAGRLRRVLPRLAGERFCLTYGDGLADVDLAAELSFHEQSGRLATVLAVRPAPRFGALDLDADGGVRSFQEKPLHESGVVNGGFFVLEPEVERYLTGGDAMAFEATPLQRLAAEGELAAFRHDGFWQPCDTLRDLRRLEDLWESGDAPWKVWGDDAP